MAYTKTSWVARVGTALNRFLKSNETDDSVELTNDPTGVTTAGTPFTAANMNKIEQGIYDNSVDLDTIKVNEGFYSKYDLIVDSDEKLALLGASTTTTYKRVFIVAGTYLADEQIDLDAHGVIVIEGCGEQTAIKANYVIPASTPFIKVGNSTNIIRDFVITTNVTQTNTTSRTLESDNVFTYCNVSNIIIYNIGNIAFYNFQSTNTMEGCKAFGVYIGFSDCNNIVNCVCSGTTFAGFSECDFISNCKSLSGSFNGFGVCNYLTNCYSLSNDNYGFSGCDRVSNCYSYDNGDDGFSSCDFISNCYSRNNTGYGFDSCDYVTTSEASGNSLGNYDTIANQSTNKWS